MIGGTLLWKCRLCGDVVRGVRVVDVAKHLVELIDAPKKSSRIGTHRCRHGAFGVTDLAGADPDKETATP